MVNAIQTFTLVLFVCLAQGTSSPTPWILKWGWMESFFWKTLFVQKENWKDTDIICFGAKGEEEKFDIFSESDDQDDPDD